MKRMLSLVGAVTLMGLTASGLKAQKPLALGDPIRVSYTVLEERGFAHEVAEGLFHGVSKDSIFIVGRAAGDTLGIPLYWVDGVEAYRPGGGRGSLLPALLGGIIGASSASNSLSFVGGATEGGLLGHSIGASMGNKARHLVKVPMADVRGWSSGSKQPGHH